MSLGKLLMLTSGHTVRWRYPFGPDNNFTHVATYQLDGNANDTTETPMVTSNVTYSSQYQSLEVLLCLMGIIAK